MAVLISPFPINLGMENEMGLGWATTTSYDEDVDSQPAVDMDFPWGRPRTPAFSGSPGPGAGR